MSGILDKKQRVLDTIITDEGRRQMSRGKMNIRYATFTDQDTVYESDTVSGSADTSYRYHFEAFSRPQDIISFEANDVGNLIRSPAGNFAMKDGKIIMPSTTSYLQLADTTDNAELTSNILSSAFNSFKDLYAIASIDVLATENEFNVSQHNIKFNITNNLLAEKQAIDTLSIDAVESLFQDKRLSHAPNFKFLPPINKPTTQNPQGQKLAPFNRIDQGDVYTFQELQNDIAGCEVAKISFSETSRDNNIFGQFFDLRQDRTIKLDVIDFGEFTDEVGDSKHVFFAGRIFKDVYGAHTYINIFTFIFE